MTAPYRGPFSDPADRIESHQLILTPNSDEERNRARLKVASVAENAADCALLLDALGLNYPVEIDRQLKARATPAA